MVTVFVEGGGHHNPSLRREARRAFVTFFQKAGLAGQMPTAVLCGTRIEARDNYCAGLAQGEPVLLLVDSEGPVRDSYQSPTASPEQWRPWGHLLEQKDDKWQRPDGAEDMDCHLMVQAMESWFLADRDALVGYFGKDFNENALPPEDKSSEAVGKAELLARLKKASKKSAKKEYSKGPHSFKILALLDPRKVAAVSPWAKRFLDTLRARCAALPEGKHR